MTAPPVEQLDFLTPPARPVLTSQEAAERAKVFAARQRGAVYAFIQQQGRYGATQREVAEGLSLGRPSVCARVYELEGRWAHLPARIVRTTLRRKACGVYIAITL